MKKVKCSICKRERKVEDFVIMSVCDGCQKEMEIVEDEYD